MPNVGAVTLLLLLVTSKTLRRLRCSDAEACHLRKDRDTAFQRFRIEAVVQAWMWQANTISKVLGAAEIHAVIDRVR